MNLGCGRRQGYRDERRGSDVYEVGTDNGTATTTTKCLERVLTRRTYKQAFLWLAQGGSCSTQCFQFDNYRMTGSMVALQQYNQQWRVGGEVQETRFQKPKLNTMDRGHQISGWVTVTC